MSIPINTIVSVNPGVLAAGGGAVALNGLMLSKNVLLPSNQVLTFSSADAVGSYFGTLSSEYIDASVYFKGFDGSTRKPGRLLIANGDIGPLPPKIVSGTLSQPLSFYAGLANVSINISSAFSAFTVSLTDVTSFSMIADRLQAAIRLANPGNDWLCTYDASSGRLLLSSALTTVVIRPTGNSVTPDSLNLSTANGAVVSANRSATSPSALMDSIIAMNTNWASFFFSAGELSDESEALLYAVWTNEQNNRYAFIYGDASTLPETQNPAATSFGYQVDSLGYSGIISIFDPGFQGLPAFVAGIAASIPFDTVNGRIVFAGRYQTGLLSAVTTAAAATNLEDNGYNYLGQYANAVNTIDMLQPGTISGAFQWMDSYYNQIWLNANFEADLVRFVTSPDVKSFNDTGTARAKLAIQGTINAALSNGVIVPGVILDETQRQEVNQEAGADVASIIEQTGWASVIKTPSSQSRKNRRLFDFYFWYTDGQSIQRIVMTSVAIQ